MVVAFRMFSKTVSSDSVVLPIVTLRPLIEKVPAVTAVANPASSRLVVESPRARPTSDWPLRTADVAVW